MKRQIVMGAAALLVVGTVAVQVATAPPMLWAQTHAGPTPGPYAEQQSSSVRGLTEPEIAALGTGQGIGLARPGEINGYPGPMHVLELADDLELGDDQRATMQSLVEQMKSEAIPLGEQFLERYAALEGAFRDGSITAESLTEHTTELGRIEGQLRATHLKYHLVSRTLLTDDQLAAYAHLRGYTDGPAPREHRPGMHDGQGR